MFGLVPAFLLLMSLVSPVRAQTVLMGSPTCAELTIMEYLSRFEPLTSSRRGLNIDQQRDIARVRRDTCAPYVGYRVIRNPTTTWANGIAITRFYNTLNYPNAQVAKTNNDWWYYPSGKRAKSGLGTWEYPTGMLARTRDDIWYAPDGKLVDDPAEIQKKACRILGRELCPFGKADEDLIVVTMMGVLSQLAEEKDQEKGAETQERAAP